MRESEREIVVGTQTSVRSERDREIERQRERAEEAGRVRKKEAVTKTCVRS